MSRQMVAIVKQDGKTEVRQVLVPQVRDPQDLIVRVMREKPEAFQIGPPKKCSWRGGRAGGRAASKRPLTSRAGSGNIILNGMLTLWHDRSR